MSEKALYFLGFLIQFGIFMRLVIPATRWVYKRTRNNEINRKFVHDMATNHLPHVYGALRQIATAGGIELKEPPPIQFIELNGHSKRRDDDEDDDEG